MVDFIYMQKSTWQHRLATIFLPVIIVLGYVYPVAFWVGLFVFFLMTSFKLLKSMLFWMLVLGGISLIFPPLAPFIFVVMVIFFILRIGFVIKNWRPFSYGILFYSMMAFLVWDTYQIFDWGSPILPEILYELFAFDLYIYSYELIQLANGIFYAIIATVILRGMLVDCYRNGYESYVALGVMGSAPLIIISFLLPFLKIHIGDPVVGEPYVTETKTPASSTYVEPYVRTAPDGILQNNYSYTGTDKMASNAETTNVSGHMRGVGGEGMAPTEAAKANVPIKSAEPVILPGKSRLSEDQEK